MRDADGNRDVTRWLRWGGLSIQAGLRETVHFSLQIALETALTIFASNADSLGRAIISYRRRKLLFSFQENENICSVHNAHEDARLIAPEKKMSQTTRTCRLLGWGVFLKFTM
jgi:hypothetical protein